MKALPKECCMNVGGAGPFKSCSRQASHWYNHNDDICSYCEEHNYQCGTKIIMKTIEYFPRGKAFADDAAEKAARRFLTSDATHIVVSTENFITASRALIAEKVIEHTNVHYLFQGHILQPDEFGRMVDWPAGFCDHNLNWVSRILNGLSKPRMNDE